MHIIVDYICWYLQFAQDLNNLGASSRSIPAQNSSRTRMVMHCFWFLLGKISSCSTGSCSLALLKTFRVFVILILYLRLYNDHRSMIPSPPCLPTLIFLRFSFGSGEWREGGDTQVILCLGMYGASKDEWTPLCS